ncbi:MAG: V-type synthase subunit [Nitrospirae bacterium]|nr:V-type synthase subunit [Nitrospirota bacterium]
MAIEKVLVALCAALAIGLTAIATAWAQSRIGAAGAGTLAEKPELSGTIVILVAIPETMVILGFVIATMILFGVNPASDHCRGLKTL